MTDKLQQLKEENDSLYYQIKDAEQKKDFDTGYKLKKQLYQNKIKMLDLINAKQESSTITARELKEKVSRMKKAISYETGIREIDNNLGGGFEVGTLIQLGGESFSGKTTLFLNIISNISKYSKATFFNFEMGDRRIIKRLQNLLTDEKQWDNMLINSTTRNIDDLIMEITILADEGIKFFAIDSRMKVYKDGQESEAQKISSMSSRLAECATRNDIIILMINQVSEDDLKNKRLSFKGSGDQKYDADIAMFIVIEKDGTRKLICSKNRTGNERLFTVDLPKSYNNAPQITEYKVSSGMIL